MSTIFNVVWLLHELKKATSGIDDKANVYVNMHDAMSTLYKMRQGSQESNDHFLAWFKTNVTAVKLTGGDHVFFSPKLAEGEKDEMHQDDIEKEEERSKAVLLLKLAQYTWGYKKRMEHWKKRDAYHYLKRKINHWIWPTIQMPYRTSNWGDYQVHGWNWNSCQVKNGR